MKNYIVHGYIPFSIYVTAANEDHASDLVFDMTNREIFEDAELDDIKIEEIEREGL